MRITISWKFLKSCQNSRAIWRKYRIGVRHKRRNEAKGGDRNTFHQSSRMTDNDNDRDVGEFM